jgi:hypothetical protein
MVHPLSIAELLTTFTDTTYSIFKYNNQARDYNNQIRFSGKAGTDHHFEMNHRTFNDGATYSYSLLEEESHFRITELYWWYLARDARLYSQKNITTLSASMRKASSRGEQVFWAKKDIFVPMQKKESKLNTRQRVKKGPPSNSAIGCQRP